MSLTRTAVPTPPVPGFAPRRVFTLSLHMTELIQPNRGQLGEYLAALEGGFNPNPMLGEHGRRMAIELARDRPDEYLALAHDPEGLGPPVLCPDGSTVPRLPSITRWIWDNGFCGTIGFRWRPGTTDLPPTCLGHIGYAVVPWRQGMGIATRALALMLEEATQRGMPFVTLTTRFDFIASQRVIQKNGGTALEEFITPPEMGAERGIRFRIDLPKPDSPGQTKIQSC
jgi:predicted acetyltransferase